MGFDQIQPVTCRKYNEGWVHGSIWQQRVSENWVKASVILQISSPRQREAEIVMGKTPASTRIEIIPVDSANIEIRLHEGIEATGYHSWKMARSVATLTAFWWKYRGKDSEKEKRFTHLIISMPSSGLVDVKELDALGHPKQAGWSLPVTVVEALAVESSRDTRATEGVSQ